MAKCCKNTYLVGMAMVDDVFDMKIWNIEIMLKRHGRKYIFEESCFVIRDDAAESFSKYYDSTLHGSICLSTFSKGMIIKQLLHLYLLAF